MPFILEVDPTFSRAAAARFAADFPGTRVTAQHDTLSFAWALGGDWATVRVTLHQDGRQVHGQLAQSTTRHTTMRARRDVEHILSADVDGTGFTALAEHDHVIAGLQKRLPGLRPALFFTPYEAAAWTVIGHRIRMTQATTIMNRLSDEIGDDGAFPPPRRLAELDSARGLSDTKVHQLRAVAQAALDRLLTRDHLRKLDYEAAVTQLQQIPGIGPFSAELIVLRGVGAPDAFPAHERRLDTAVRAAYALSDSVDSASVAEGWRPFRSWVALLLRAGQ